MEAYSLLVRFLGKGLNGVSLNGEVMTMVIGEHLALLFKGLVVNAS
jgi:hypothetical protein